ncbi:DUF2790 domain-containing protein [Pseudomonas putida]
MKRIIIVAAVFVFSLAAQASAFSDKKQLEYLLAHQKAVATYAEKNGKPMPEVQDYKYGMKIDVAKFVRQSQDPRDCSVYPRLMSFEDAQGRLKTVRYSMVSHCINNK